VFACRERTPPEAHLRHGAPLTRIIAVARIARACRASIKKAKNPEVLTEMNLTRNVSNDL
jgi:hypothetical protein